MMQRLFSMESRHVRLAAFSIRVLKATPGFQDFSRSHASHSHLIREEEIRWIGAAITSSSDASMRTTDQSLYRLIKKGTIFKETCCSTPSISRC